jgi:hypothetical protein
MVTDGSLQWEQHLPPSKSSTTSKAAQLWTVPDTTNRVAWQSPTANNNVPVLFDATTGKIVEESKPKHEPASKIDRRQVFCDSAATTVQWKPETKTLVATSSGTGSTIRGEYQPLDDDVLDQLWLMDCQPQSVSVLATSRRGTSAKITFQGTTATVHWSAHEDLAQITSALMLDASHEAAAVPLATNAAAPERVLEFSTRLALQWQSVQSMLGLQQQQQVSRNDRDSLFGFVKIAVLLSSHGHVYGMETAGPRRTQLRYQIALLPSSSDEDDKSIVWQHRLVHGSTNAEKGVHGIHGGAHNATSVGSVVIAQQQQQQCAVDLFGWDQW